MLQFPISPAPIFPSFHCFSTFCLYLFLFLICIPPLIGIPLRVSQLFGLFLIFTTSQLNCLIEVLDRITSLKSLKSFFLCFLTEYEKSLPSVHQGQINNVGGFNMLDVIITFSSLYNNQRLVYRGRKAFV